MVRGPHHGPGLLPGHPDDLHLAPAVAPVPNFGEVLLQALAVVGAAGAEAVVGVVALVLVCSQAKRERGQHGERSGLHSPPASHLLPSSEGFSSLIWEEQGLGAGKSQSGTLSPSHSLDLLRSIFPLKSRACPSPHPVQRSDESPAAAARTAGGSPGPCWEV